jgi:glycine/D-amino acid oxidase-like deaminating enzyme
MQTDVLIVGFGLAGWAMTESLQKANKSFVVIDSGSQAPSSSRAATGIYNPTVLKRFRAINCAQKLMDYSIPYYKQKKYESNNHPNEILRVLTSTAEQNDWIVAADKPDLAHFLSPTIQTSPYTHIDAPHGVGTVQQTGWVDVPALLNSAKDELITKGVFVHENFAHASLTLTNTEIEYKQWKASYVVFAEGVGILTNPWFSSLPLIPNKGEWLVISCPGLGLDQIIKGSVFIVPLGDDRYRVGASYTHDYKHALATKRARIWLEDQLNKYVRLPFKVLSHGAGLRPTVPDRKPLLGQHPKHPQLVCINGLGSRGVLWAPYAAFLLTDSLFQGRSIPKEFDLRRFLPF